VREERRSSAAKIHSGDSFRNEGGARIKMHTMQLDRGGEEEECGTEENRALG